jgi:NAD(P)-dependent dehydrogenase (short-subunit alcohol dehydrogenase family)
VYDVPTQENARVVVTGANSGTGKEAARRLARAGADVVMAVRSLDRGNVAREEILAESHEGRVTLRQLDLADLASVEHFAAGLLAEGRPLHILLNNAGVMRPRQRTLSADGLELQFATNFLGHFALTLRLVPLLRGAGGARVVTVSSTAAVVGRVHFDDLQFELRYRPFAAYAQSKLADLLFARRLATLSRERGWDVASLAAHPGFTRTNLFSAGASIGRPPRRSPLESRFLPSQDAAHGVEPLLYAATSPEALNGAYYGPDGLFSLTGSTILVRPPRSARSEHVAARLWEAGERLTGLSLPAA